MLACIFPLPCRRITVVCAAPTGTPPEPPEDADGDSWVWFDQTYRRTHFTFEAIAAPTQNLVRAERHAAARSSGRALDADLNPGGPIRRLGQHRSGLAKKTIASMAAAEGARCGSQEGGGGLKRPAVLRGAGSRAAAGTAGASVARRTPQAAARTLQTLSLCCGMGGLDLSQRDIQGVTIRKAWAVDISPSACTTFKVNNPSVHVSASGNTRGCYPASCRWLYALKLC